MQFNTKHFSPMPYTLIVITIVVSFTIGGCIFHIYRGRVRRKESKKQIAETKERDEIFQTVEPFNSALYIESNVDLNHPDLNFNN